MHYFCFKASIKGFQATGEAPGHHQENIPHFQSKKFLHVFLFLRAILAFDPDSQTQLNPDTIRIRSTNKTD
jgi:hypothetical protein